MMASTSKRGKPVELAGSTDSQKFVLRPNRSRELSRLCRNYLLKMSVSKEILDQLLSGHLDGALSSDEKKQIEQLLRDDPNVARELGELRGLRNSMREVRRIDNQVKLDDGFADRVLSAAVARAKAEGLGEDHPLIRLTEKPSRPEPKPTPRLRIASTIVALAASIAVAIVVLRQPQDDGVAVVQPQGLLSSETVAVEQFERSVPEISVPEISAPELNENPELRVGASDEGSEAVAMSDAGVSSTPENVLAKIEGSRIASAVKPPLGKQPSTFEPSEADLETLKQMQGMAVRGAPLLVIKVKRTELGKSTRCVRGLLKSAGLDESKEKELTAEMVGFLNESADKDTTARAMVLTASSKKIDVFVSRLFADTAGIKTVGLSLTPSRGIVQVANLIAPRDPKLVRHSSSWELQGSGLNALVGELDRQQIQMRKTSDVPPKSATSANPSLGEPDGISQVLVWIE